MPSKRDHVKRLGLRCETGDTVGGLRFRAGSVEKLEAVIEEYGPLVWTVDNQKNMIKPTSGTPYPRALIWPADKRIAEIFKGLFEDKAQQHGSVPFSRESVSSTSSNVGAARHPLSSISKSTAYPASASKTNDMCITEFWIMTVTGQYSAPLSLGRLQTIPEFLTAVEAAFRAKYGFTVSRFQPGSLQEIYMVFSNLGPAFSHVRGFRATDDDEAFRNFRSQIKTAYREYRDVEDQELVLGCCTAVFSFEIEMEE